LLTNKHNYNRDLGITQLGLWLNYQLIDDKNSEIAISKTGLISSKDINSLAYTNWCRLYLTVINEHHIQFEPLKKHVKDNISKLSEAIAELWRKLSNI
jgi:hypothetical protein